MIRRWWQRFVDKHAPLIDWPEIGSDDEPCGYLPADDLMAVARWAQECGVDQ